MCSLVIFRILYHVSIQSFLEGLGGQKGAVVPRRVKIIYQIRTEPVASEADRRGLAQGTPEAQRPAQLAQIDVGAFASQRQDDPGRPAILNPGLLDDHLYVADEALAAT